MSQDVPEWGTLPGELWDILVKDSVELPDLDLIWPQVEIQRQRACQALIKRLYNQILHGCGDSRCRTSTCATRQKRTLTNPSHVDTKGLKGLLQGSDQAGQRTVPRRPFRSFTKLSARALAVHLASQDCAEKRLCPYLPTQADRDENRDAPPQEQLPSTAAETISETRADVIKRKDPKSLAQNLFDTAAVETFYTTLVHSQRTFSSEQKPAVANSPTVKLSAEGKDVAQAPTHVSNRSPDCRGSTTSQDSIGHGVQETTSNRKAIPETSEVPRTLTYLSLKNIKALVELAQECERMSSETQLSVKAPDSDAYKISRLPSLLQVYAAQSMYYVLNTPKATGASFRKTRDELGSCKCTASVVFGRAASKACLYETGKDPSSCRCPPSVDFGQMVQGFHWLRKFDGELRLVMASLPVAIKSVHLTSSVRGKRKDRRPSEGVSAEKTSRASLKAVESELDGEREAAHVALQVFAVLVALIPPCTLDVWHVVFRCHQSGKMVPDGDLESGMIRNVQLILDAFEAEPALSLLSSLCKALATRLWVSDMDSAAHKEQTKKGIEVPPPHRSVAQCILHHLFQSQQCPVPYISQRGELGWQYDATPPSVDSEAAPRYIGIIVEWLRYFVIKQWDGKAEIDRFSAVGGALEILWCFDLMTETPLAFQMPVTDVCFDWLKLSTDWLSRPRIENPQHILTYPFLFSAQSQIACFRALNYAKMFESYEDTIVASRLLAQMSFPDPLTSRGEIRVQDKLGALLRSYFVIEIRRESVLFDAIEQLWRREKRDLMKPLKVRMGMDEGEEGIDHGGVQQEFFRLAIVEVMNPDYGMFTVDEQSGMSWFRPCSLEPLYKFELVGLLFGLAIYNGLTLPVNFPLAFYQKLRGLEITKTAQIQDGWPALAKGLESLLNWSDGDVGDVFARTYEFTAEGPGFNLTVDMEKNGRTPGWVPVHLNPDYCCPHCYSTVPRNVYKTDESPVPPEAEGSDGNDEKEKSGTSPLEDSVSNDDNNNTEGKPFSPLKSPVSVDEAPADGDGNAQLQGPLGSPGDQKGKGKYSVLCRDDDSGDRRDASPSPVEASLVTNANREQYVSDYIFWLTNKSIQHQFEAFAKNFFTCISFRAPSLFSVRDFKRLVEGSQDVSVEALRNIANYEGYTSDHPTITDFWDIVSDFSPRQISLLLEFVTASDRIPATGMGSVQFSVQKNGEGDARLPTSSTCYGRLLLPQYSGKAVLREKLCLAIENSKGFGVA